MTEPEPEPEVLYPLCNVDAGALDRFLVGLERHRSWDKLPYELTEDFTNVAVLNELLEVLDEHKREVVIRHYGLATGDQENLSSIGARFGADRGSTLLVLRGALKGLWHELAKRAARRQWRAATTQEEKLVVPVEILEVPREFYRLLRRGGMASVGDVIARTEARILVVEGLGSKRVATLKIALTKLDLALKEEEEVTEPQDEVPDTAADILDEFAAAVSWHMRCAYREDEPLAYQIASDLRRAEAGVVQALWQFTDWLSWRPEDGTPKPFLPAVPALRAVLFERVWKAISLRGKTTGLKFEVYRRLFNEDHPSASELSKVVQSEPGALYPLTQLNEAGVRKLFGALKSNQNVGSGITIPEEFGTLPALNELLSALNTRHREVIIRVFALASEKPETYTAIGRDYGVSGASITESLKTAMQHLGRAVMKRLACQQWAAATTQAEKLAVPIDVLDLSLEPYRVLRREGMLVLGDLVSKTASILLDIRTLGSGYLDEIKMQLDKLDLALCQE